MLLNLNRLAMPLLAFAGLMMATPIVALSVDKPAAKPSSQAAPEGVFEDESTPKKEGKADETPAGPLKVGVIISKFTATGPSWAGAPYGYLHAAIAKDLAVDGIELHAIIEPGSEDDADFMTALAAHFPPDVPRIDGHDAAALKALNVIVGQRIANMQNEMVQAIHEAVNEGTGLFIAQTFGTVTPGYNSQISDLFGMDNATYAFNATPIACEVKAVDALLEGTDDSGTEWQAQPSGTAGVLREGGTPLVQVSDVATVRVRQNESAGMELPMLYLTHLGKGGIVVSNFKDLPDPLKNMQGDNYFVRCVKRAAALREP